MGSPRGAHQWRPPTKSFTSINFLSIRMDHLTCIDGARSRAILITGCPARLSECARLCLAYLHLSDEHDIDTYFLILISLNIGSPTPSWSLSRCLPKWLVPIEDAISVEAGVHSGAPQILVNDLFLILVFRMGYNLFVDCLLMRQKWEEMCGRGFAPNSTCHPPASPLHKMTKGVLTFLKLSLQLFLPVAPQWYVFFSTTVCMCELHSLFETLPSRKWLQRWTRNLPRVCGYHSQRIHLPRQGMKRPFLRCFSRPASLYSLRLSLPSVSCAHLQGAEGR